jgi:hypothetical protein
LKQALQTHKPDAGLKKCGLDGLSSATALGTSPDEAKTNLQFAYWTYVASSDNGLAIWDQTLEAISAQTDPDNQGTIVCEFVQIYPEHSQKLIDTLAAKGIKADAHCLTDENRPTDLGPQTKLPDAYPSGDASLNGTTPDPNGANPNPNSTTTSNFDCQDDLSCWNNEAHQVLDDNSPAIIDPNASPTPSPSPTPTPEPAQQYVVTCFGSSGAGGNVSISGTLGVMPGTTQALTNVTATGSVIATFPSASVSPSLQGTHRFTVWAAIATTRTSTQLQLLSDSPPTRWQAGTGDYLQLYGGSFGITNPYFFYWADGAGNTFFTPAICWLTLPTDPPSPNPFFVPLPN